MEDIAPELLERIRERFENAAKGDGTLLSFLRRAEQETAMLGECGDYADRLGELLAKALAAIVTPQALPNGILYQNIAEKLLKPTLREVYERVNVSAARVQKAEDARRHIGLNAVKPDFPDERVWELSYVAGRRENTVEQALSYLQEPVRTISRSFFDDFVRENAKARWYAGMDPVVSREASPKCCDWCAALAGNWDYDDARTEGVFRRHQFCRCTVTYSCDGRAQDVWSKKFYDVDPETIRERAEYNRELIRADAEKNGLANGGERGIIISGAVSGALNPDSEKAEEHAVRYYEAVRHMTTDIDRISENTGIERETIAQIKHFIFLSKHDLGGEEPEYFAPEYRMAQSWQRLIEGSQIQEHDLTLLRHEIMEIDLMSQGHSQEEAHIITSKKYNYSKEADVYYDSLEKYKKESQ